MALKTVVKGLISRVIGLVIGHTGKGKTHWTLTAPGPISFLNFDFGDEFVVEKFLDDKEVKMAHYLPAASQEEAKETLKEVHKDLAEAIKTSRTLIVDTATGWWEMERIAAFGKTEQVPPTYYTQLNSEFRRRLMEFFALNPSTNVLFIEQMRKKYNSRINPKTGKEISVWDGESWEIDGFGKLPYIVQFVVEPNFPEDEVSISKCRIDGKWSSEVLPYMEFAELVAFLTGTDPENWSV